MSEFAFVFFSSRENFKPGGHQKNKFDSHDASYSRAKKYHLGVKKSAKFKNHFGITVVLWKSRADKSILTQITLRLRVVGCKVTAIHTNIYSL